MCRSAALTKPRSGFTGLRKLRLSTPDVVTVIYVQVPDGLCASVDTCVNASPSAGLTLYDFSPYTLHDIFKIFGLV